MTSRLDRPVDGASVAVFRVLFGALMLVSTLRFFAHGWIAEYYVAPKYFFHYWGFGWVRPWPGAGMSVHYLLIALAAGFITLGVYYRFAAAAFTVAFGYAHFCDKANYLNHYYLATLLGLLFAVLPLDREYSVRVWRRPAERRGQVRAWVLYLLRFQIGVVYVFGGIAKLNGDWLMHGEPLRIWLSANAELPGFGHFVSRPWFGLVFSWAGAAFDLSIVPLLSFRPTRKLAYGAVLAFHLLTAVLFQIGMFPWLMIACATLFFDPSWPRAVWLRLRAHPLPLNLEIAGRALGGRAYAAAAYVAFQVLLPVRSLLYPGNTLWTEEGFRFAWKVMLIEKSGTLELEVRDQTGHRFLVSPSEYLTPFQARMARTQPDMVLELCQIVARDFERRGHGTVEVYADAQVSFNGRRRQRLLDPTVNLAAQADTLAPKPWILPAPQSRPIF